MKNPVSSVPSVVDVFVFGPGKLPPTENPGRIAPAAAHPGESDIVRALPDPDLDGPGGNDRPFGGSVRDWTDDRGETLRGMDDLSRTDEAGSAKGGKPTDGGSGGKGGGKGGGKPSDGGGKPSDGGGDSGGGDTGGGGTGGGVTTLGSYTSGSADGSGFNIEVIFSGSWTAALQQSFIDAADLISTIIRGDLPDVSYLGNLIDDVRIEAQLVSIDGAGGVLGQAGPTVYRSASYLPAQGIMEFDTADAEAFDAKFMFNDIVFHEMVHVLGFGTMWSAMGLVTESATGRLTFNGANANLAFDAEFSATEALAIETQGGSGTAGGHLNENGTDGFAFLNEIMTGYINTTGNYLSNTSIAALEDMGYDTLWDAANPLGATGGLDMAILNDHLFA